MLKNLSIKNFAIIESIDIEFEKGLNILIGETGAGKSIIIDSLSILLGEKALTSFIREGSKKSIIEGTFEINLENPLWTLLKENDIDFFENLDKNSDSSQLIIRREISLNGNSRIFINDSPVQYNLLKTIGDLIIDFHGQFEHQSLIDSRNHLQILDAFSDNFKLLNAYRNKLSELKTQITLFEKFKKNQDLIKQELDTFSQKLNEIENVNPKPNEDNELEKELQILVNSELIHTNLIELSEELLSEENSLYDRLTKINKKLEVLSKFDEKLVNYSNELFAQLPFFKDLSNSVKDYLNSLNFEPKRIEEINQRLYKLIQLKKKYGSIHEILEYKEELITQIESLKNIETSEAKFRDSITILKNECAKYAIKLSESRNKQIFEFENNLKKILVELGFTFIDFKVNLIPNLANKTSEYSYIYMNNNLDFSENGFESCEFLISTNAGEKPKELSRIASGGELSRIMLSLKTLGATDKNLPILVFDEIDSGVSGRIAQKVGQLMINFSKFHQIICITHTPQVAAAGNCIISIEKKEDNDRTISLSRKLNEEQKVYEIAKFLSGISVSASAINSANELIKNYKN